MSKYLCYYALLSITLALGGCKKCFSCYNECVLCSVTVNNQIVLDTLCNDEYGTPAGFHQAIANDTTAGYLCAEMESTYNYDFCVNKPGEEDYPNYYNKGKKVKCDEK